MDDWWEIWEFPKLEVPDFGALIIRILLFKVLQYLGSPNFGNCHTGLCFVWVDTVEAHVGGFGTALTMKGSSCCRCCIGIDFAVAFSTLRLFYRRMIIAPCCGQGARDKYNRLILCSM